MKFKFALFLALISSASSNNHLLANQLIYGESTTVDTFDPYTTHEASGQRISDLLFDALVVPEAGGGYKNHLAESTSVRDTGSLVLITLRKDVYWHGLDDNSPKMPLRAQDVITTINLIKSEDSDVPNRDRFEVISRAEAMGEHTLRIQFKRALQDPMRPLTFKILPSHILADRKSLKRNDPFVTHPIGTGPYKLAKSNAQGEILLIANKDYFLGKPNISQMIMKTYSDPNIMAQSLLFNSIDLMTYVSPRDLPEVMGDKDVGIIPYDALSFTFFAFNQKNTALKDKRVRQAISLAINRQEMLEAFFQNRGTIITGPFPPTSWAYNINVKPQLYDPSRAEALLDKAGYKSSKDQSTRVDKSGKPLSFDLVVPIGGESETIKRISLAFQGYMTKIGVTLNLKFMDWLVWKSKVIGEHDFDITMASWSFDDANNITSLFHSGYDKPWGNNFIGYRNDTVDALLVEASSTNDFDKRRAIYQKIHSVLADETPYAFLWTLMHHAAYNYRLSNIHIEPNAFFSDINKWTLNKEGFDEQSAQ